MSFRPSLRPDPGKKSAGEELALEPAAPTSGPDAAQEIATLARALANAGGGELSLDLAVDLVLNETVEQARQATRATGAAIALSRDGEMICRATTGNAPELGTAVDTASGLSSACLSTGTVQECSDTENDPRVNREVCRHLHLRSMLLIPIIQEGRVCGILEVFSSQPNNFGPDDYHSLQRLANNIVKAKIAAELGVANDVSGVEAPAPAEINGAALEERSALDGSRDEQPVPSKMTGPGAAKNEILNSALVVLIIATAVLLGVVVGVREMAKRTSDKAPAAAAKNIDKSANAPGSGTTSAPKADQSASLARQTGLPVHAPVGGLIVTQNGKVIYRSDSSPNGPPPAAASTPSRLLRRVDPEYPESAKSQHIEGAVVLEAQVLGDGTVGNVAIVQGDPLLAEAAANAVKQWKYQPYSVNGRPVEREERITVKFSLPTS